MEKYEHVSLDEVISKLEGLPCGSRPTSCPDQLTKGIKAYLQANLYDVNSSVIYFSKLYHINSSLMSTTFKRCI